MDYSLKRIFCVDDEEDILTIAKLCLEKIGGFEVSCMLRSVDALQAARVLHPDLILVDVMMPVVNGPTMLMRIREDETLRDTPVAFLTARVQNDDVRQYLELGAAGVIAKPFDPMMLSQQVTSIWEQYRLAA
jgi:two-component system OmpR family response regulator